jgi:hypothetical protein
MNDFLLNCVMLTLIGGAVFAIGEHFRHTASVWVGLAAAGWGLIGALYWLIDLGYFGGSLPLGGS